MVKELKKTDDFDGLVAKGVSILDFNATWCGPCRMLHPVFEAVSEELKEYNFIGIDIDENPILAGHFNIRSVPTIMVVRDGKVLKATAGYMDESTLKKFITSVL